MTKESSHTDDSLIISRLRDPETRVATFSFIVKKYSPLLYHHIHHMVLSHEDSDDILQNTFIKVWNNIDKFRGESHISTWLYRIATNETLTFLSQRKIDSVSLSNVESTIAEQIESDPYFNGNHAHAILLEAISKLPEKQRLVFNMKYFEEMKYEDISIVLGTSVGALKASYHIAVKKIEEYIEKKN
ncbi:MAG: sigma-70 family RNA polymerase sigma factor [Bacteroidaceae bacterium]|nr:sigma-70 family RNA polymerase sigma factor [Bacteroidaceae bacterium]